MKDLRVAYVTPNINQAGSIIGQLNISWRNVIEAGAIGGFLFLLFKALIAPILPLMPKIIVGFVLIFPFTLLGLFGISGVPLSEWIMDIVAYRMTRCYVTLKMPMPLNGKLDKSLLSQIDIEYTNKDPRVLKAERDLEKKKEKEKKRKEKEKAKIEKRYEKEQKKRKKLKGEDNND